LKAPSLAEKGKTHKMTNSSYANGSSSGDQVDWLPYHTDTCVVGDNTALVIQDFEHPVSVVGYDRTVGAAKNCKTIAL